MAPRRSVNRTASATPARSTRATGAVAVDSPPIRRSTRASSQQPGVRDDVVNNPKLPELQTQQSYAYGATKTPNLPQQLGKDLGDMRQIVDTIDDDVVSQQRGQKSSSSPPPRQQRGSSQEPTQVPTQRSQRSAQPTARQSSTRDKHARVEAWADSLEDSQLDDVPEEDDDESELPDDATHKDTDPSSFPDVMIDHSYNYERGLRKPRPAVVVRKKGPSILQRSRASLQAAGTGVKCALSNASRSCTAWFGRVGNATAKALQGVPDSPLVAGTVTLLVVTLLIIITGFIFCSVYTRLLCSPSSTSIIATNMQKICGSCSASPPTFNFSPEDTQDLGKITTAISALNQQMQALEQRLSRRIDSNQAALEAEMNALKIQHNTLSTLLHDMQYSQPAQTDSNIASPLIPKINFFAPSNGALVHPLLSSPTRAHKRGWPARLFMMATGLTKYQSHPPVVALEPWQDIGDCWCGPDVPPTSQSDVLRLAVTTREMLFPTELVIEHFPPQGSLRPDTAPKTLELWADFGHLGYDEWQKLQLADMQEENVLGPRYAKLGQMEYNTDPGSNHVQRFRLDVNQHGLLHYARDFTLRVKENYGAEFGCLYRVRLHGLPLSAKEGVQHSDAWVSGSGYATEE
jgi:hypothetical protein